MACHTSLHKEWAQGKLNTSQSLVEDRGRGSQHDLDSLQACLQRWLCWWDNILSINPDEFPDGFDMQYGCSYEDICLFVSKRDTTGFHSGMQI